MKRWLLFMGMFVWFQHTHAQASDFIVVKKKNNRTLKTYFPGLPVSFVTIDNIFVNGTITAIKNDSVFVNQLMIRTVPTIWGVTVQDTAGSFSSAFYYKDIRQVFFDTRRKAFSFITDGTILLIGGAGYALLNVFNGVILDEPLADNQNKRRLGIALSAVGVGFLLKKLSKNKHKKNRVEYVRMNDVKKQLRGF